MSLTAMNNFCKNIFQEVLQYTLLVLFLLQNFMHKKHTTHALLYKNYTKTIPFTNIIITICLKRGKIQIPVRIRAWHFLNREKLTIFTEFRKDFNHGESKIYFNSCELHLYFIPNEELSLEWWTIFCSAGYGKNARKLVIESEWICLE